MRSQSHMCLLTPIKDYIRLYQASFLCGLGTCKISRKWWTVLQGLEGVLCYIDDIRVSSEDEESHFQLLGEVFNRLQQHGFRLKQEKLEFLLPVVEYLGHQMSSDGIQPLLNKVDTIVKAPKPQNFQQLRSFLGHINYYGKFIPNFSTLLQPLNRLLQATTQWNFNSKNKTAFQEAKKK